MGGVPEWFVEVMVYMQVTVIAKMRFLFIQGVSPVILIDQ